MSYNKRRFVVYGDLQLTRTWSRYALSYRSTSSNYQPAPPPYSTDTPSKTQNGMTDHETPRGQGTTIGPASTQFTTPQTSTTGVNPPARPVSEYTIPATTSSSQDDYPSLEAQLHEAKAQIAALTKQLETNGLRHRGPFSAQTESTDSRPSSGAARDRLHAAAEQGVPVKIVAYLCLAAFLLAYLFF